MKKITSNTKLPFGKHRGIKLRDVPNSYLQWCAEKLRDDDFHEWAIAAEEEINRRLEESSPIETLEEQANKLLREAGYDPENL